MKILCTFPGKFGDLLWALPTIRAISRRIGAPVDLLIPDRFASLAALIQTQPYIGVVATSGQWITQDTAPISPRVAPVVPQGYDAVIDLGYRSWPTPDCVRHTMETFNAWSRIEGSKWTKLGQLTDADLALQEPWITVEGPGDPVEILTAFTEEYFELKVGLVMLLQRMTQPIVSVGPPRSRWFTERPKASYAYVGAEWLQTAKMIRNADVVLADCSALHVLAVAMGTPAVIVEPSEARHNSVFWPLGTQGPQVTLVKGSDGQPTVDARHVRDTLEGVLRAS